MACGLDGSQEDTTEPLVAELVEAPPPALPAPEPAVSLVDPEGPFLDDLDGAALDRFRAALARAEVGEGQVRVVVFGSSHLAGDHLVGFIRDALQRRFGDAGHGWVSGAWPSERDTYWQSGVQIARGEGWKPVRLGRGNASADYYGVGGVVFDSEGREAVAEVSTGRRLGLNASHIEVHWLQQPRGGELELEIDGEVVSTQSTAGRVRAQMVSFERPDGPHRVRLRALPGEPVRMYSVVLERDAPGVIVDNIALGGTRARFHLRSRAPVYESQLRQRRPDLVVMGYGGNEGNDVVPIRIYERRLREMMRRLQRTVPDAECLFLGPFDKPLLTEDGTWVERERTSAIAAVQQQVARDEGCAYFDTLGFMGGPLSLLAWAQEQPSLVRGDNVHLTGDGYRRVARTFLRELLRGVPDVPGTLGPPDVP